MIKLKNAEEAQMIRESCQILAKVHVHLAEMIVEGVSTWDIDMKAREFIQSYHGKPSFLNYMGFPAAVCVSINEEVIHGIPKKKRFLKNGDIVSLDLGVEYKGYYSDAACTYGVGTIDDKAQKLIEVTQECLDLAIAQCVPGKRIRDIGSAVYAHAKDHGYGVVRDYTGHGVGFSQHEDPQVPNYPSRGMNPRLRPGMVLAIEPMINLGCDEVSLLDDDWTVVTADAAVSAHFEHTVLILKDGVEILTK